MRAYTIQEIYESRNIPGDISDLLKVLPFGRGYVVKEPGRVKVFIHGHIKEDHRRFVSIGSAWLDGNPTLIFMRAGREGRDKEELIITDPIGYKEMLRYIASLIDWTDGEEGEGDKGQELKSFYGYTITELLEANGRVNS